MIWFKANVELILSRLEDDERVEQGLPITPEAGHAPLHAAGSLLRRARGRQLLSTRRRMLHVQVLCAHAHARSHSLTLPANAERAGDLPSRRALIRCVRTRIH